MKSGYPGQRCSSPKWDRCFPLSSTSHLRLSSAEPTRWTPGSLITARRRSASPPRPARKRYAPFFPPTRRLTSGVCSKQEVSSRSLPITPGPRWKPPWRPCCRHPSKARGMDLAPWSSTSASPGALPSSERAPLASPISSLRERTLASTTTAAITSPSTPLPTPALTWG